MNLSALPSPSSQPTFLFYIYGPCSAYIASLSHLPLPLRDEKLTAFLHPYISLLPNYSATSPHCTPKAIFATAWAGDELAGYGSYANFQTGLEEGDKHVESMRKGMPERGIWIAGEHTAPFVALGTATGAYWSGEKVALRILEGVVGEDGEEKETE
jgi:hypothetical protein